VDEHQLTVALVLLGALGLASQWVAWKFRLPAIVLLLASGLLAGPALGILRPEEQLGPMLRPVIRLAVALILFEGGLSLRLHELRHVATGVRRLVLLGVPIAWILGSVAARFVGGSPGPSRWSSGRSPWSRAPPSSSRFCVTPASGAGPPRS
jgi:NhaP-type Na+/H+ or K+/H+ antiporter